MSHDSLQARTAEIVEHIGRSDSSGNYYHKQNDKFLNEKHEQRQLVLDFILPYFSSDDRIRLLSMPGKSWSFENLLLLQHPNTHLVGLEASKTIFLQAARALPGLSWADYATRTCRFGNGQYMYSKRWVSTKWNGSRATACHRIIQMTASTFCNVLEADYHATVLDKRKFNTKFYYRNCAWLDFTSGFCAETEAAISKIHWPLWFELTPKKPIAITMMFGRDISGGIPGRIRRIAKLQPRYEHKKHWVYSGKNGTPMITLCGEIQE